MHILQIETITVSPPCFIENLCPFLRIIDLDLHVRQVHRIAQVCFARRNIRHIKSISFEEERFLAAGSDTHRSTVGHHVFFLFFQVEYFRTTTSPVVNLVSVRIEISVIGRAHRQLDDTVRNPVEIDLDNRSSRLVFLCLIFLCRCIFL